MSDLIENTSGTEGVDITLRELLAKLYTPLGYKNRFGRLDAEQLSADIQQNALAIAKSCSLGFLSATQAYRLLVLYNAKTGKSLNANTFESFVRG